MKEFSPPTNSSKKNEKIGSTKSNNDNNNDNNNNNSAKESPMISFGETTLLLYTWEESLSESGLLQQHYYEFSYDSDDDDDEDEDDSDNLEGCDNIKKSLFQYSIAESRSSSSCSATATTATPSIEVKISNRQKHKCGINVAASFIVDYLLRHKEVSKHEIDIVAGMIVLGKEIDVSSTKGKIFLRKVKNHDLQFAEMAFMSAWKVKDLGGDRIDMETAVVATLACRGFRYLRNMSFTENQLIKISDYTARSAMNQLLSSSSSSSVELPTAAIHNDKKKKDNIDSSRNKNNQLFHQFMKPMINMKQDLFKKTKLHNNSINHKIDDENNANNNDNSIIAMNMCHCIFMDIFACDTIIADLDKNNNGINPIIVQTQTKEELSLSFQKLKMNKNLNKKIRHAKGIECATDIIIKNVVHNNQITHTPDIINTIVIALVTGQQIDINNVNAQSNINQSLLVQRMLKRIKEHDYRIAESAFVTAVKIKQLGGNIMSIYSAIVPTLATRNLRSFRNITIEKNQVDYVAEKTAKSIMPTSSIEFIESFNNHKKDNVDHHPSISLSTSDITPHEKNINEIKPTSPMLPSQCLLPSSSSATSSSFHFKQAPSIEATVSEFAIETEISCTSFDFLQ